MNNGKKVLPIFFVVDDYYIPFLSVTLQSLIDNSSIENYYTIKILYTNISEVNKEKIKKYEQDNVNIEFVNLSSYIEKINADYTTFVTELQNNLVQTYQKELVPFPIIIPKEEEEEEKNE